MFLASFVLERKAGLTLAIIGGMTAATGILLLVQNTFDVYATWSYACALVAPMSMGLARLVFGAALLFNQAILDSLWQSFRAFPLIAQLGIGLLLLPLVIGLWIWQTPWPFWLRLVLVFGLGIATVYTFFPKQV
jgi:hypothetical protein